MTTPDQPPDVELPELAAWYLPGAVILLEMRVATVSEDVIVRMVEAIDALRARHAEEIARCGGTWSLHDWRCVQHFPTEARHRLTQEWEKLGERDVRRVDVALSPNPLMHARAQVMSLVSMRRAGTPIRIVDDIDSLIAEAVSRVKASG